MKAKVLVLTAIISTATFVAKSQGSATFGIRAGVNFQNITGKEFDGSDVDGKLKPGFNVGVNAEVPVAPDFYVQPGVLFSTKGRKDKDDDDIKINLSYIEVPINFLYKPALGDGKLLLGIGPYIAFAVGGKFTDNTGDETDIKFKNSITAQEFLADPYAKRIDVGGNLLFGYELSSKISAQLNAQLGMVKINPKIDGVSNDKTKYKNTGFGISLGYRF
jgi:outer membrane protein with beta-barrel domain